MVYEPCAYSSRTNDFVGPYSAQATRAKKMTRDYLAWRVGIDPSYVSLIESGALTSTRDLIGAINIVLARYADLLRALYPTPVL